MTIKYAGIRAREFEFLLSVEPRIYDEMNEAYFLL
jgi:hypothetical protein